MTMNNLVWTKEPPTEPGWYLVRKRGESRARVVRVIANVDGWAWVDGFPHAHGWEPDKIHEWAGPIPKPAEEVRP